jgi:hypothetical protein
MSTEAFKPEAPSYSTLNSETSESANMSSEPPKMDAPVNSVLGADSETPESAQKAKLPKTHYPTSFWLCFAGLCGTGLISALDSTVLSTSLPTIINDLNGGSNYIWVVNVYFLTW